MGNKALQWHPAFHAAFRIELAEEQEFLQFCEEYNLSEKPLRIDTLVIKMSSGHVVGKSIGRIFRQYNIVEYKSPEDYFSINDFYKVMAYACIYQSNTKKVMEISPEELTLTFVCSAYPGKVVRHLQKQYGARVREADQGIFYIEGMMFPMQILLTDRLSKEEYVWLSRLRRGLRFKEDMEPLAKAYKGKDKDPLYEAVMDLIVRANEEDYEEGGQGMCDALRELFADELAEREERGKEIGKEIGKEKGAMVKLISLVHKKYEKGMPAEKIAGIFEEDPAVVRNICQALQDHPESTDEDIYQLLQE